MHRLPERQRGGQWRVAFHLDPHFGAGLADAQPLLSVLVQRYDRRSDPRLCRNPQLQAGLARSPQRGDQRLGGAIVHQGGGRLWLGDHQPRLRPLHSVRLRDFEMQRRSAAGDIIDAGAVRTGPERVLGQQPLGGTRGQPHPQKEIAGVRVRRGERQRQVHFLWLDRLRFRIGEGIRAGNGHLWFAVEIEFERFGQRQHPLHIEEEEAQLNLVDGEITPRRSLRRGLALLKFDAAPQQERAARNFGPRRQRQRPFAGGDQQRGGIQQQAGVRSRPRKRSCTALLSSTSSLGAASGSCRRPTSVICSICCPLPNCTDSSVRG